MNNLSTMLEELRIIAIPKDNKLNIILDGYFLMSEVELMLHIIKRESRKLRSGFEVKIDIRNFRTASQSQEHIISKMKKVLRLLGSGSVGYSRDNRNSKKLENRKANYLRVDPVGLYS